MKLFSHTATSNASRVTLSLINAGFNSLLIIIFMYLAGCVSMRHRGGDSAPNYKIDETKIPDAVPKDEPLNRHAKKSYTVKGHRYYVMKSYVGYSETGIASWYGMLFHKRHTSSGEIYDVAGMTAAHKTLPIPCYARVTNLKNGRQIIVKINDRGPFHENRIIDLSYVAAKKLQIYPAGTGLVRVTTIDPRHMSHETPEVTIDKSVLSHKPEIVMQIGAFAIRDNAENLAHTISRYTHDPIHIKESTINHGRHLFRVQIGPMKNVDDTDELHNQLRKLNLGTPITVIE